MIRINLLPHREEKRKARRQQFYVTSVLMAVLGAVVWLLLHVMNSENIDGQESRNNFLKDKIAALDKEIGVIKDLRQKIDALLARKQVIEALQSNRAETVHLFNELAARVPSGVYLTRVSQSGDKITLKGYAQSNARVSSLMSSLNDSPFLENSKVIKIAAELLNNRRVYGFEMEVFIEKTVTPVDTAADKVPTKNG